MKVRLKNKGTVVELSKRHFLAQGGEASIYVKDRVSYKIYTDRSHMIPLAKIEELAGISRPEVMKPDDVLLDEHGVPVGCTMRFVADAYSLCQLFTMAFKQRNGVTQDKVAKMVENMQEVLLHVHEHGVIVVDLNEMNLLADKAFGKVSWIDVDSWQTPSFPATAIMDSVRDWNTKSFTELSDWFSFAIVTFQLWMGIHPYKGSHPQVKGLKERMTANLSVFNSAVGIPKMCPPLDSIPDKYRAWYKAVLEDGQRILPPSAVGASAAVMPKVQFITGTDHLSIVEFLSFGHDVLHFVALGPHKLAFTADGLYVGKTLYKSVAPTAQAGLGPKQRVVVADSHNGWLELRDLLLNKPIELNMKADAIMSYDGRIYFKSGDDIHEVTFLEMPDGSARASARQVASVMPKATKLFDGVVIQDMLGAWYASVFPLPSRSYQFHLKELDGWKLVDAKFDNGVLMVVGAKGGSYNRWVFVLQADFSGYVCREWLKDIAYTGLNFVVLETGVCAHIDEQERLELFANKPTATQAKVVDDPVLTNAMKLYKCGPNVLFSQGSKLYKLSTRK
jgi:hypothetical protein